MKESMDKQVAYLEYTNRENNFHHHGYSEDMMQFVYLKDGDLRSVEQTKKLMESGSAGHLSDNPVSNMLYLNICHITLCTRFAIEGGMNPEKAYNASDLFIRRGRAMILLPIAAWIGISNRWRGISSFSRSHIFLPRS